MLEVSLLSLGLSFTKIIYIYIYICLIIELLIYFMYAAYIYIYIYICVCAVCSQNCTSTAWPYKRVDIHIGLKICCIIQPSCVHTLGREITLCR